LREKPSQCPSEPYFRAATRTEVIMNNKGFTLIEMMMCVAMFGVFSTMAVPLVSRARTRLELRSTTRTMAADMSLVRDAAIGRKNSVISATMVISSPRAYSLYLDRDEVTDGDEILVRTVTMKNDLELVVPQGGQEIRFYKNGTAASGATVVVRNPSVNASRSIVLSGLGFARIE
jgi:prepilin-type N-terminal cleavage/methylation domain-containing protein